MLVGMMSTMIYLVLMLTMLLREIFTSLIIQGLLVQMMTNEYVI